MKEEILNRIKINYNNQLERQNKYKEMLDRKKELEKEPLVIEYLSILENMDDKILSFTENQMLDNVVYKELRNIEETNGIYVYLGTYSYSNEIDIVHGSHDNRVNYNDEKADYRVYRDLESRYGFELKIVECEKFERENNVIFPKRYLTEQYFCELQLEFFRDCIEDGQEKAVSRVMRKVKK